MIAINHVTTGAYGQKMEGMREFRPPVRPSKLRFAIVVMIALFGVVPIGGVAALLGSTGAISYTIAGGELAVSSGGGLSSGRRVRLSDITEARAQSLSKGRRTAGTAMPGYCVGRFSYPDLGGVWQATSCGGSVVVLVVKGEERPIVLSPPDREGFLRSLESGAETTITLPPPDKGVLSLLMFVVVPLSLVTTLMVGALLLVGPRKMRYLVGDGALEVHTLFGKKRWPTGGSRAKRYKPGRVLRVAGTAAPGYFTGIYREGGQTTRVYATDREQMVLFEGPDRVLLSPEDQEGFLAALASEGARVEG